MNIHPNNHGVQLNEKELLNVVGNLCHFIMYEVVNMRGKFFHEAQDLATEGKYIGLREWDDQLHCAATSSSPTED